MPDIYETHDNFDGKRIKGIYAQSAPNYAEDALGMFVGYRDLILSSELAKYCAMRLVEYDLGTNTETCSEIKDDKTRARELLRFRSSYTADRAFIEHFGTEHHKLNHSDVGIWCLRSHANAKVLLEHLRQLVHMFTPYLSKKDSFYVRHAMTCGVLIQHRNRAHTLGRAWMTELPSFIDYKYGTDLILRKPLPADTTTLQTRYREDRTVLVALHDLGETGNQSYDTMFTQGKWIRPVIE